MSQDALLTNAGLNTTLDIKTLPQIPKSSTVCGDPGRSLWYEYVGQYFTVPNKNTKMTIGTVCDLCGSKTVQLYDMSKISRCAAHYAITAKRAGRKPEDPPGPIADTKTGMTNFGDGAISVAGPQVRWATVNLFLTKEAPSDLKLHCTSKGSTNTVLRKLISNPPPTPFVAIMFGQKADFKITPTTDASLIHINGKIKLSINRSRVLTLMELLKDYPAQDIPKLFHMRARIAQGTRFEKDQETLQELQRSYPKISDVLASLPSPFEADGQIVKKLLKDE